MKRLLSGFLAVLLLCTVAIASTEYRDINIGEYVYQVPSSWEVDYSDNGFTYIYETGDVFTGVYISSKAYDVAVSPAEAQSELEAVMTGAASNGIEGTCEVLNDLKCDSLNDLPFIAFTYDMNVYGTKMEPVYFVWTDYSKIYSISYADMSASFKYVCGNFQPILDTLSLPNSNTLINSNGDKAITLDELAEMINSEMAELAFSVEARADESANCFVYEIRANTIPYDTWVWCTDDVKDEYKSKFAEIVKKVDDSVDKIGYTDVTTIAMFTLSNGEVTYMAVNGANVYESQGSINKSAPEPTVTTQPATEAKKYTELKLGDSGMQVYKMKKKLVQYGYLENGTHDKFDDETEQAVIAFNKQNFGEEINIADERMQELLFEGVPPKYEASFESIATVEPVGTSIRFREMEWYSTQDEILTAVSAIEGVRIGEKSSMYGVDSYEHTSSLGMTEPYVFDAGTMVCAFDFSVAGYTPSARMFFMYPIVDGKVLYEDNKAEFYKATYVINTLEDIDGAYEDLKNKLISLYGDGEELKYDYTQTVSYKWVADDGSLVIITKFFDRFEEKRYDEIYLTYYAPGADERIEELSEQIQAETIAAEELEREENAANVSGL